MPLTTFAAINVGSSDVELKIYEISGRNKIRELDQVHSIVELGSDTYSKGIIGYELVNELCLVLERFKLKMEEYRVMSYIAYGTSALREAGNRDLILDQIKIRTGLKVKIISNAEQSLLIIKSVSQRLDNFEQLINEGALVLALGAGSLQLSLFEAGVFIFSQNILLGALRIREILSVLENKSADFVSIMEDYISNEIGALKKIQLKRKKIKHIIVVGEEFSSIIDYVNAAKNKEFLTTLQFNKIYHKLLKSTPAEISKKYGIPYEMATLIIPSSIVYKQIIDETTAEILWEPRAGLCDGMAINYSESERNSCRGYLYDKDIISVARNIAGKYESDENHINNVASFALNIFDGIKKLSGLGIRQRLLLQIAAILHDCGGYINTVNSVISTYYIVKETEIIGLSDEEREIVAKTILFHGKDITNIYQFNKGTMNHDDYMIMIKLSGILGIANGMDRSHKQKIKKIRITIKGDEMKISADTIYDITLEQDMVHSKSALFEEIYGIKPILRQKRKI